MGLFRENYFTFLALLLLAPFYTLPGPFDPRLWRTLELPAAGTAAAVCYGPAMAAMAPLWPCYGRIMRVMTAGCSRAHGQELQQPIWPQLS